MDTARPKSKPWKGWREFAAWAQDFSLRRKVLGGFLGVVVIVGLVTSFIGTRLAKDTILERARMDLTGDLVTAQYVMSSFTENLERNIRLVANSDAIRRLLEKGDMEAIRNRLAIACVENDMDYLSLTDDKGRVLVRGLAPHAAKADLSKDPIIKEALEGRGTSGASLVGVDRLTDENTAFPQLLGASNTKRCLILEAAQPIMMENRVGGVVYGGMVLNQDKRVVERISRLVFKGATYQKADVGYVTIFEGDEAVSTTLKAEDGLPATGLQMEDDAKRAVLEKGEQVITRGYQFGRAYFSAIDPIRDFTGKVIGAIQIAALQEPINWVIDRLVATFLVVALLGVLLMAAISYFLVQWINRPLELMLHAARQAAEGDLSHEVPVIARDEVGELAATFNLMIRNLAASQKKLEEWGKELASKVAAQTGELNQAREQVARVKKLASLEKMADGMARIMAHISDPLVPAYLEDGDTPGSATSRVLVLDQDENVLDISQRILEGEGFEVQVARTVEDCLKALEEDFYDVVVADIDMPGTTGTELLKEIKYRQPDLMVIFTAPFKATEEAVEAVKLGAFDYIPKPFGPHQILLMVYTALQTRQAIDRTRREHASERAEKIFQRLPVAIALADRAHRVVYNNRAFLELASRDGQDVHGRTFKDLFGVDPLERGSGEEEAAGSRWLELEKVGRTAKLYNFKLPEEDLRVLMLVDITDTIKKDQQADVLRHETLTRAQQVIHQQMRVAQEIAGLLGETTAETKAALFELINLARETGEQR